MAKYILFTGISFLMDIKNDLIPLMIDQPVRIK